MFTRSLWGFVVVFALVAGLFPVSWSVSADPTTPHHYAIQRVLDASVLGESAKFCTPVDINDRGDVLLSGNNGYTWQNKLPTHFISSLMARADGTMVHLQPLPGDAFTKPLHFLPDGSVFGASVEEYRYANGVHTGVEHPVIWHTEEPEELPFPHTIAGITLRRLPSGDLLLWGVTDTTRRYVSKLVPVLLHQDGTYLELPVPPGSTNLSFLVGSQSGMIAGGTQPGGSPAGNPVLDARSLVPLLWRDDQFEMLTSVPGYRIMGGFSINDHGQVLAFTDEIAGDHGKHAGTLFWPSPDSPRIVPRLSTGQVTRLWALNDGGDAVGGSYHTAVSRAVLYSGGRLWDLNALTVNRQGVVLGEAYLVSNQGHILAASIKNEKRDVFYLLAPLPRSH